MPNWKSVLDEINSRPGAHDITRRKYLRRLAKYTGRNVIAYYSGWLQKAGLNNQNVPFEINDSDKNAFMATINKLDRSKGLDLILHTPGGDVAATESIIDYIKSMFSNDIRAIIPQIAMSAGTMIALACKEILMGKHSNIGPIDPQVGGLAAHGILEEFNQAVDEVRKDASCLPLWQSIIGKLHPTVIVASQKAIQMAESMVSKNLADVMFAGDNEGAVKVAQVVAELTSTAVNKTHSRHVSIERAIAIGLKVSAIENDNTLQDAVLSVHHAFIHSLSSTNAFKITENQRGVAFIQQLQSVLVRP